jgi:Lon-like ATP-dependent protease
LTITKLAWRDLVPDTESYQDLFSQPELATEHPFILSDTQPRLHYALEQALSPWATSPFMLLKAPEEAEYLTLLGDAMRQLRPEANAVFGGQYRIAGDKIAFEPADQADDRFAAKGEVITANWVEAEQLFGCLRQFNGELSLQPGLVHRANGGVLIISLRTLLSQPLLWMRLKTIVTEQRFDWVGYDESRPLPVSVPSMPLSLTVVLTGDRESLADFQEMEPELAELAVYSEYEDNIQVADADDMAQWCQWVLAVAERFALPMPAADAWPGLIREAVRYTGDQETLPLSPLWIGKQLREQGAQRDDQHAAVCAMYQTRLQ